MTTRYRTVGKVIAAEVKPYGFVFRIKLSDHSELVLPFACAIMSEIKATSDFGRYRLAMLATACGLSIVRDTDELLNIEFIVTHSIESVKKVEPIIIERIVEVPIVRKNWWTRLLDWITQ